MTAEYRTELREVIERATDLDGAGVRIEGESWLVEKDGQLIATFPKACPQSCLNVWLFLACGDNLTEILDALEAKETKR